MGATASVPVPDVTSLVPAADQDGTVTFPVVDTATANAPSSPTENHQKNVPSGFFSTVTQLQQKFRPNGTQDDAAGQMNDVNAGLIWEPPKDCEYGKVLGPNELNAQYDASAGTVVEGTYKYYIRRGPLSDEDADDYYGTANRRDMPWYTIDGISNDDRYHIHYHYTISTHSLNTPSQHTLKSHYQHTLSTQSLTAPSHPLSTQPSLNAQRKRLSFGHSHCEQIQKQRSAIVYPAPRAHAASSGSGQAYCGPCRSPHRYRGQIHPHSDFST